MRVVKTTKINNNINQDDTANNANEFIRIDSDLDQLFTAMQGRIRFGTGTDGDRGENLQGEFQTFTSHAVADTEFNVTHGLGAIPIGLLVVGQDKAGSLYQLAATGTAWTATTISLKCDASSVTFNVFLLK